MQANGIAFGIFCGNDSSVVIGVDSSIIQTVAKKYLDILSQDTRKICSKTMKKVLLNCGPYCDTNTSKEIRTIQFKMYIVN